MSQGDGGLAKCFGQLGLRGPQHLGSRVELARLGGDGALPLSLGGSGQAGELILGMTDLAPGTPEEARVPYTDVYRRYEASARLAIDSLQPPPHLEALVREYFSSLAP